MNRPHRIDDRSAATTYRGILVLIRVTIFDGARPFAVSAPEHLRMAVGAGRSRAVVRLLLVGTLLGALAGCRAPIVKPEAFLDEVLADGFLPDGLVEEERWEERVVHVGPSWMEANSSSHLTFARYRDPETGDVFALVLEADAQNDRLVLLRLRSDETPLDAVATPEKRAALLQISRRYVAGEPAPGALELSLSEVIAERRLGVPIADPRRVLAVAASFPSHLEVDLGIGREHHRAIAETPPRVFQKHPFVRPPEEGAVTDFRFRGTIGPFDEIVYPEEIALPADENQVTNWTRTALDYEVELGVVIGRDLEWEDIKDATDEQIYSAIAGYVLVSDVKARNPQVFERALARGEKPDSWDAYYRTGDPDVDLLLGNWTQTTCAWWGYAASLGDFAAIGPYFVAAGGEDRLPPRALLAARAFGPEEARGAPVPSGRTDGSYYLRQCSRVTTDPSSEDALLWNVPAIVRGILSPGSALHFEEGSRKLERGDVVALGTPGGIVLTARHHSFYRMLGKVLFWWSAIDWHDAFFGKDLALYLREGDRTFFWAEGLGYQNLLVRAARTEIVRAAR